MNFKIDNIRIRLFLKIGLAYLLISLFVDLVSNPETFIRKFLLLDFWRVIFFIFSCYYFFEKIVPQITRKRILKSLFLIAASFFLFSIGHFLWHQLGTSLHIVSPPEPEVDLKHQMGEIFGESVGSLIFFGLVRHIYDYRKLKIRAQQLQIEKQEAELNYLKSQTNPHFLFNTLNNIYSLARDKSDLAPESIMRLSKMLRYMLYETSGNFIAIEQELKIITDYIELEKLRYDESLRISFKYDVEDMKQAIPPLLLIPLVENAFKHGVSETRNRPFVDIFLSVNQRQLKFVVKNSTEDFLDEKKVKENIGLSNLRRQLVLLYKEYDLVVNRADAVFSAQLKINLASHV